MEWVVLIARLIFFLIKEVLSLRFFDKQATDRSRKKTSAKNVKSSNVIVKGTIPR